MLILYILVYCSKRFILFEIVLNINFKDISILEYK